MRRNPERSLLDRCLAFYYYRTGLSCDDLAALLQVHRRTILKWEESDEWQKRKSQGRFLKSPAALNLDTLNEWLTICLAPISNASLTTNHFPPDQPRWSYPGQAQDWQRFRKNEHWRKLSIEMHPSLLG